MKKPLSFVYLLILISCQFGENSPVYKFQDGSNSIKVIKLENFLPYVMREINKQTKTPAYALMSDSIVRWTQESEVLIEDEVTKSWSKYGEITFIVTDFSDDSEVPIKTWIIYEGRPIGDFIDVEISIINSESPELKFARNDIHNFLEKNGTLWSETYQFEYPERPRMEYVELAAKGSLKIDNKNVEVIEKYGFSEEDYNRSSYQIFKFRHSYNPYYKDSREEPISLVVDESILDGNYDSRPRIEVAEQGVDPRTGKKYYLSQTNAVITPYDSHPHDHVNVVNDSQKEFHSEEETVKLGTQQNLQSDYLNYGEVRGTLLNSGYYNMEEILGEPNEKWQRNSVLTYLYYFKVEKFGEIGHIRVTHTWGPDVIHRIDFFEPGDYIPVSPVQKVKSPLRESQHYKSDSDGAEVNPAHGVPGHECTLDCLSIM
ncbi:hypothetical protein [Christiangramia echinicola]|uniref:hypothetical protein n=1 Tax=Christiangramia echinicola TaxID=279359 RepID=UPI00040C2CBB|nr:hypothetical protein [Christiangramia echinicola]